ncbi:hypothetical protein BA28_03221, partial [Mycobacterium tuberculosis NRITLD12]
MLSSALTATATRGAIRTGRVRAAVEIIADGVHVHPAVVHAVIEAVGPDRVAVVT